MISDDNSDPKTRTDYEWEWIAWAALGFGVAVSIRAACHFSWMRTLIAAGAFIVVALALARCKKRHH